ncbi:MAG: helix-hairpin-helix domain-containing protein [Bacteroidota bacterium]|nr:helix-hairpin-helix domain-containing protein [Bacteroidota bacterium]
MVNKEIAAQFNLLTALMELHGENSFKTKAYLSAYQSLRKWDRPLSEMTEAEYAMIPGVGASAAAKIGEIIQKGSMEVLEKLKAITPEGIQQLLQIKGMGPKKIRVIWDSLGVETPAELLYACNENRLVNLPGFGLKTQEDLSSKIAYFLDSQHRYLYGVIEKELLEFEAKWNKIFPKNKLTWVGDVARKSPIISSIECIISPVIELSKIESFDGLQITEQKDDTVFSVMYAERYPIRCYNVPVADYVSKWSEVTMAPALFSKLSSAIGKHIENDIDELLNENGFTNLPAEMMDYEDIESLDSTYWQGLIERNDLKGILHNHSTYSDGINTLEEMSNHVRDAGYEYFGISDHSQSAFYANGLLPQRVLAQMEEIDALNEKMAPFRIFKGIESDILNDGLLDYEPSLLAKFDFIVASIHSNLRMDEDKATARLIKAIENPYTRILGHPTSRLLLARPGYPIDYKKVIDACAANNVVMELNANPQRMDIDYSWIRYCQEKSVMISINPDAHSRSQVEYVKFGVFSARKGGLKKENCLNAKKLGDFSEWVQQKK